MKLTIPTTVLALSALLPSLSLALAIPARASLDLAVAETVQTEPRSLECGGDGKGGCPDVPVTQIRPGFDPVQRAGGGESAEIVPRQLIPPLEVPYHPCGNWSDLENGTHPIPPSACLTLNGVADPDAKSASLLPLQVLQDVYEHRAELGPWVSSPALEDASEIAQRDVAAAERCNVTLANGHVSHGVVGREGLCGITYMFGRDQVKQTLFVDVKQQNPLGPCETKVDGKTIHGNTTLDWHCAIPAPSNMKYVHQVERVFLNNPDPAGPPAVRPKWCTGVLKNGELVQVFFRPGSKSLCALVHRFPITGERQWFFTDTDVKPTGECGTWDKNDVVYRGNLTADGKCAILGQVGKGPIFTHVMEATVKMQVKRDADAEFVDAATLDDPVFKALVRYPLCGNFTDVNNHTHPIPHRICAKLNMNFYHPLSPLDTADLWIPTATTDNADTKNTPRIGTRAHIPVAPLRSPFELCKIHHRGYVDKGWMDINGQCQTHALDSDDQGHWYIDTVSHDPAYIPPPQPPASIRQRDDVSPNAPGHECEFEDFDGHVWHGFMDQLGEHCLVGSQDGDGNWTQIYLIPVKPVEKRGEMLADGWEPCNGTFNGTAMPGFRYGSDGECRLFFRDEQGRRHHDPQHAHLSEWPEAVGGLWVPCNMTVAGHVEHGYKKENGTCRLIKMRYVDDNGRWHHNPPHRHNATDDALPRLGKPCNEVVDGHVRPGRLSATGQCVSGFVDKNGDWHRHPEDERFEYVDENGRWHRHHQKEHFEWVDESGRWHRHRADGKFEWVDENGQWHRHHENDKVEWVDDNGRWHHHLPQHNTTHHNTTATSPAPLNARAEAGPPSEPCLVESPDGKMRWGLSNKDGSCSPYYDMHGIYQPHPTTSAAPRPTPTPPPGEEKRPHELTNNYCLLYVDGKKYHGLRDDDDNCVGFFDEMGFWVPEPEQAQPVEKRDEAGTMANVKRQGAYLIGNEEPCEVEFRGERHQGMRSEENLWKCGIWWWGARGDGEGPRWWHVNVDDMGTRWIE